jgi:hypothetical protein
MYFFEKWILNSAVEYVEHGRISEDVWLIIFLRVGNGMDLLGGA